MPTLRDKIVYLTENKKKHFSRMIRNDPELLQEISSSPGDTIPEKTYNYLHGTTGICELGNKKQLISISEGYRFCGRANSCECAKASHSAAMSALQASYTQEEKTALREQRERTTEARYGVKHACHNPEIEAKRKATCRANLGVDHPLASLAVQQKIKETHLNNLGVESPFQSASVQQKCHDTAKQKYGHVMAPARTALKEKYKDLNPAQVPEVKEKRRQTTIKKYNRESIKQIHLSESQLENLKNKEKFDAIIAGKSFKIAALDLGVNETTVARYCNTHNSRHLIDSSYKSILEERMKRLLTELDIKFIQNTKQIIKPLELDFYLPDYNLAFEVGSLYTHAEISSGRDKKYHNTKWKMSKEKGIAVYQWFDDEINSKWPVIVNKIKYLTKKITNKVGARKVKISTVALEDEKKFLDENHIQGFSSDRSYALGGYYNGKLVSVMTFAKREKYIELTRYATKLDSVYPGLFTKMLTYSKDYLPAGDIVSFSANNHSDGNLYQAAGFEKSHEVSPTYFYTNNYKTKQARNNFMKKKLLKKFPELDPSLSEWAMAQALGYDRIWDSGKIAWIMKNKPA